MKVRYTLTALSELEEIFAYLEKRNPKAAAAGRSGAIGFDRMSQVSPLGARRRVVGDTTAIPERNPLQKSPGISRDVRAR